MKIMNTSFDEWVRNDANQPCVRTHADALIKLGTSWDSFRRLDDAAIVQDLVDAGGIPLLAARDIVRIAKLEIEKSEAPMAIFWDIENTHIPTAVSGRDVVTRLRTILAPFGQETQFRGYASIGLNHIPQKKRSDLQLSGCHLVDCPHNGRKEVADKMIIVDAMKFAYENPDGATLCFITGDVDYSYMLATLQRPAWRTIVISRGTIKSMLHVNCDMRMRWETDILQNLDADTDASNEMEVPGKVTISEDAKSADTGSTSNSHNSGSNEDASEEQTSSLGKGSLSPLEAWADDVELLKLIFKENGESLSKQQVDSLLRKKNPARFPDRSKSKDFLTQSIEQGVVIETGEGPYKELSLPSSTPTIKRIPTHKFIPSAMFEVLLDLQDVSEKRPFLMFALKSWFKGIGCKPKRAYIRPVKRWLLLLFMTREDALKAAEEVPQLFECTLVDRRTCQSLDERDTCGHCFRCRKGLAQSEIVYQTTRRGQTYKELACCSDCYRWNVKDGEKETAIAKVVETMKMLEDNDDILVSRKSLKKWLYLRYSDVGLCKTHKHAELWIDAAANADRVAPYKKKGQKKPFMCLTSNSDLALKEKDVDDSLKTVKEEDFIVKCLKETGNCDWICRKTINEQLESKFPRMKSPFLRSRVLDNGKERSRFALVKGPYGQTVALNEKEAQESLERMTKSIKGELEWDLDEFPSSCSEDGSAASPTKSKSPEVLPVVATTPPSPKIISHAEPRATVEVKDEEKDSSDGALSDWEEESIDYDELESRLSRQMAQNSSKRASSSLSNKMLLAVICIAQIAQGMALAKPLAGQQFVGFDLGTSGARVSVIEPSSVGSTAEYEEIYSKAITWKDCGSYDDADAWMMAIETLLKDASGDLEGGLESVTRVCVSGTSASCLVVDRDSQAVTRKPRMYDYDIVAAAPKGNKKYAEQALACLERHVPEKHTARAQTGSLAKLLCWLYESPLKDSEALCHQSEFVAMKLMGNFRPVKSDWHNCLKLGYDVKKKRWPDWIEKCLIDAGASSPLDDDIGVVPVDVVSPGTPMGTVGKEIAHRLGLGEGTVIVGGTTDSNAAFFAAAGAKPPFATAVTSLGSTTAIKLLSPQYVEDASRGVYSHRFPVFDEGDSSRSPKEAWLVGGASNVGCVVLRALDFSNDELESLSEKIDPTTDSPLSYYPLVKKGERFPVADSNKAPVLEPVPDSRKEYLHGLLQSISAVEMEGFRVLYELGAPLPKLVLSCGGGSKNNMWIKMRQRMLAEGLKVPEIEVKRADNTEASFGAALLAAATATPNEKLPGDKSGVAKLFPKII